MIAALSALGSILGSSTSVQTSKEFEKPGADFGQVLADVSAGAFSDLKTAESVAISGIQGKAPVQQVVQAVMHAEESLHTALAIRDKAVSAYQSVTQMAI